VKTLDLATDWRLIPGDISRQQVYAHRPGQLPKATRRTCGGLDA
jgi:hypothetical protein